MSSVKELEEKVKELMKEIERLKRKEEFELEYPFEDKEEYWSVGVKGGINHLPWTGIEFDTKRYEQGHIFKSEQEAIRERDKRILLTKFRQFRDKCNGDWKPDWNQAKYYVCFKNVYLNRERTTLTVLSSMFFNAFNVFGYFKKQEDAERSIELFGDEIKRLFVEEE